MATISVGRAVEDVISLMTVLATSFVLYIIALLGSVLNSVMLGPAHLGSVSLAL